MDSTLATKLVNRMMKGGNKATCEAILRRTLQHIHRKTKQPPMQVVFQAYQNAKPALENKDKRMGYKVVKIPTPVEPERGINIATKWFIESAREGGARPMDEKLAAEFIDCAAGRGKTFTKRKELYKTAVANRTFLRYRW